MSKVITITITSDDIKEMAADNDIPEIEWGFAIERVLNLREPITELVDALAHRLVQNVVLTGKVDWS